jgi:hypothetical protein
MKKKKKKKSFNALFYLLNPCESRPYTLSEKVRLIVFENRLLRGIFEPEQEEVAGRMLKDIACEGLHYLYCSQNMIYYVDHWSTAYFLFCSPSLFYLLVHSRCRGFL